MAITWSCVETNVLRGQEPPEIIEDFSADSHILEHALQLGCVLIPALDLDAESHIQFLSPHSNLETGNDTALAVIIRRLRRQEPPR